MKRNLKRIQFSSVKIVEKVESFEFCLLSFLNLFSDIFLNMKNTTMLCIKTQRKAFEAFKIDSA